MSKTSVQQAKVKSVLSGDTLVLVSVNNPVQERLLSLAYVNAPRLKRDGDEVGPHLDCGWFSANVQGL